ncbi:MAG: hypothetical protein ACTSQI_16180 [Candidatus Helarchaeota archaeon]
MKSRAKISLYVTLGLFVLCLFSTMPALAFASDSYSQQAGDQYTWEILEADSDPFGIGAGVHDYIRLDITATNQTTVYDTDFGWVLADCVFGKMYTNTPANRTWILIYPTEILIAAYVASYGILNVSGLSVFNYPGTNLSLNLIPGNETAVNQTFYDGYLASGLNHYSYSSTVISLWSDNETIVNSEKYVYNYNSEGVLRDVQLRNATGALWDLLFRAVLLIQGPNNFDASIWPVLISGPITIGLAVLYVYLTEWRKKE